MMKFSTTNHWDEELWKKISLVYNQSFEHGAKPEKILRNMSAKGLCTFHAAMENTELAAFAITASLGSSRAIIIDYLAVRPDYRRNGIGLQLLHYIKEWAISQKKFEMMIIEVECEENVENDNRICFWKKCGFSLAEEYIHHYKQIPEPYQAMWLNLNDRSRKDVKGEDLFRIITSFHRESFRNILKNQKVFLN